jgi:D-alanyl-D-alanine carboxypeptidase
MNNEINFFPPSPIKDSSNKWRNILGVATILLGIGTIFGWQFIRFSFERPELVNKFITEVISSENGQAGGDLLVDPPEISKPKLPELIGEMAVAEDFTAKSMIVKDGKTGVILFSKDPYVVRPIASITKLMSALIILEKNPDWTKTAVVIGEDSLDTHMYAGDIYTFQDLWDAALIGSSNKAIKTLANALGWPEEAFVERMKEKAKELGMSNTSFADPTGLGDENMSTASDLSILLDAALAQEKIRESLGKKELNLYSEERAKAHHMWNTNWLLLGWVPHDFANFLGGKTGYTAAAGYSFAMQVANDSTHAINVVVLGTEAHEARFTEARDIAKWTFENYRWP